MNGGFVTLPKAEVHVHLEGCFEVDDIVRLARENGVQLPRPREQLLEFGGLAETGGLAGSRPATNSAA